jgi:hypothetical protein
MYLLYLFFQTTILIKGQIELCLPDLYSGAKTRDELIFDVVAVMSGTSDFTGGYSFDHDRQRLEVDE